MMMRRCSTARASTIAQHALKAPMLSKHAGPKSASFDPRGRSRHGAPDREILARPDIAAAAQEGRDAVRAPQTHPQARPTSTTRTEWRPRRVPPRSNRPEPQEAGGAHTGTGLKAGMKDRPCPESVGHQGAPWFYFNLLADFFNRIGHEPTFTLRIRGGSIRPSLPRQHQ